MPNTAYRRGYGFERRVARHYEERGCYVCRSAGSRGPFDLVVVCGGAATGVQCKADGRLGPAEEERVRGAARAAGMGAVLAYRAGRGLAFREIHPGPGRHPPARPPRGIG